MAADSERGDKTRADALEAIFDEHYCDEWDGKNPSYTSAESLRQAIAKAHALGASTALSAVGLTAPTEQMIDMALAANIPGGSDARDWFLPHESDKAKRNIRDVVRAMLSAALVLSATERRTDFGPIDGDPDNTALENWFPFSAEELTSLKGCRDELNAIHHACLNPEEIVINDDDTNTVKAVKFFIQGAICANAELLALNWGRKP